MGRKIFITYKYGDTNVRALPDIFYTKARDYVTALQELIDKEDHINKGEEDGQSLEDFEDEAIASSLRDKIYDSSITIVLISRNMKTADSEKDQWIPWEISYSLKEHSRNGRTSLSNALLAVVLPDMWGNYDYFITENPTCNSRTLHTDSLFVILKRNMFNIKAPDTRECNGNTVYNGYSSYIHSVKWDDFKVNIDYYLDVAAGINGNIDSYNIVKTIS
ncbi:TIR domain-containing protein [Mucilaginibacter flavus]|uniref:TIR domain-containing protein n=1 Tax=Mucilaginibacter flavus TaxID=931504 RepID=UPI0025B2CAF5|nr:TIR domain-containing protein [Mucilaginibacter flavus]MDN3582497.1 TIR domain-containing protein [Mucilaginibacter flavus]